MKRRQRKKLQRIAGALDRDALDQAERQLGALRRELRPADQPDVACMEQFLRADVARRRDRLELAESCSRRALSFAHQCDDETGKSYAHYQMGVLARMGSDVDRAERHLQRALHLAEQRAAGSAQEAALWELAVLARQGKNLETAESYFQRVLYLAEQADDRSSQAGTHYELARLARHRKAFQTVEWHLWQAVDLSTKKGGDRVQQADAHHELASVADDQHNDVDAARWHLKEMLRLAKRVEDKWRQAIAHSDLAELASQREELHDAERHLRLATELGEETDDRTVLIYAHCELGVLARRREDLETAESHVRHGLAVAHQDGDGLGQAWGHHELGILARWRDDFNAAEWYLERSLWLAEQAQEPMAQANPHLELGVLAARGWRGDAAQGHLEQALSLAREADDPVTQAEAHLELGIFAGHHNDLRAAEGHLHKAVQLAQKSSSQLEEGNAQRELGVIAYRDGDTGTGAWRFQRALELAEGATDRLGQANAHRRLAQMAWDRGDAGGVEVHFGAAAGLWEEVGVRSALAQVLADWGECRAACGDGGAGLGLALRGVEVAEGVRVGQSVAVERDRWQARMGSLYGGAWELAVAVGDAQAVLGLVETARAEQLAGLMAHRLVGVPSAVCELLGELEEVSARLAAIEREAGADGPAAGMRAARLEGLGGAPGWEAGVSLEEAEDQLVARKERVRARLAEQASAVLAEVADPAPVTGEELVEGLVGLGTHALVYHQDGDGELVVVWVDPQGQCAFEWIDLDQAAVAVLARLDEDRLVDADGVGMDASDLAGLSGLLPQGLREQLAAHDSAEGGPQRLLIVPTGRLWSVPFHALSLAEGGADRLVVEAAAVTLTPSLQLHHRLRPTHPPAAGGGGSVSWRDPALDVSGGDERAVLDQRFCPHRRLDEELAGDAEQVVAALREAADHGAALAVLACHGTREPGLAHGLQLTATDRLHAADLIAGRLPPLVAMGACSSGYPPGDHPAEPIGLPTIALTAGARHVLATHFAADHHATTSLLTTLYHALADSPHDPAAAHHHTLARWLAAHPNHRHQPLTRWAAPTTIGPHP